MISAPGISTTAPLVGFRAFRVHRGQLCSLTRETPMAWVPLATVDAQCNSAGKVPHLAPARGCHCGAYATDSVATAKRAIRYFIRWRHRRDCVIGAVLILGAPGRSVIVSELKGMPGLEYRAPRMRILALGGDRRVARLGAKLGLPVVPEHGLEVFAREHGVQLSPPSPNDQSDDRSKPGGNDRSIVTSPTIDPNWAADLIAIGRWFGRAIVWGARGAWWVARSIVFPVLRWLLARRVVQAAIVIVVGAGLQRSVPGLLGVLSIAIAALIAISLLLGAGTRQGERIG